MTRSELRKELNKVADLLTIRDGERERNISAAALILGKVLTRLESGPREVLAETTPFPPVSDRTGLILDALSKVWPDGINLHRLRRRILGGHISSREALAILAELKDLGLVRAERRMGGGRPATVFFLTEGPESRREDRRAGESLYPGPGREG